MNSELCKKKSEYFTIQFAVSPDPAFRNLKKTSTSLSVDSEVSKLFQIG